MEEISIQPLGEQTIVKVIKGNNLKYVDVTDTASEIKNYKDCITSATKGNFAIANTHSDKPPNQVWTHRSKKSCGIENLQQIDYVLVGIKDKGRLQNILSSDDLYVGEDHRTITATLIFNRK